MGIIRILLFVLLPATAHAQGLCNSYKDEASCLQQGCTWVYAVIDAATQKEKRRAYCRAGNSAPVRAQPPAVKSPPAQLNSLEWAHYVECVQNYRLNACIEIENSKLTPDQRASRDFVLKRLLEKQKPQQAPAVAQPQPLPDLTSQRRELYESCVERYFFTSCWMISQAPGFTAQERANIERILKLGPAAKPPAQQAAPAPVAQPPAWSPPPVQPPFADAPKAQPAPVAQAPNPQAPKSQTEPFWNPLIVPDLTKPPSAAEKARFDAMNADLMARGAELWEQTKTIFLWLFLIVGTLGFLFFYLDQKRHNYIESKIWEGMPVEGPMRVGLEIEQINQARHRLHVNIKMTKRDWEAAKQANLLAYTLFDYPEPLHDPETRVMMPYMLGYIARKKYADFDDSVIAHRAKEELIRNLQIIRSNIDHQHEFVARPAERKETLEI